LKTCYKTLLVHQHYNVTIRRLLFKCSRSADSSFIITEQKLTLNLFIQNKSHLGI